MCWRCCCCFCRCCRCCRCDVGGSVVADVLVRFSPPPGDASHECDTVYTSKCRSASAYVHAVPAVPHPLTHPPEAGAGAGAS
jgi:hypothetical protein